MKDKDKEIKDNFYNRDNYYESRHIFSSQNEDKNENLRMYTQLDKLYGNESGMWKKIANKDEKNEVSKNDNTFKVDDDLEIVKVPNQILEISNKYGTKQGCKKCGYIGHHAYQCYNFKKESLKSSLSKTNNDLDLQEEKNKEKTKKEDIDKMFESVACTDPKLAKLLKKKKIKEKEQLRKNKEKEKERKRNNKDILKENDLFDKFTESLLHK